MPDYNDTRRSTLLTSLHDTKVLLEQHEEALHRIAHGEAIRVLYKYCGQEFIMELSAEAQTSVKHKAMEDLADKEEKLYGVKQELMDALGEC